MPSEARIEGRSESKSDKTRRRILDAAAKVLRRKGYAGTRLADIAQAAGMQAGSLYYHFGSREELVAEVMRTGVTNAFAAIRRRLETLPDDAPPGARLSAAIETHLQFLVEQSDYASATIKLIGQVPDDIRAAQIINERAFGKLWKSLLREARDAGEIRADVDLSTVRMLIMGAMNWAVEWYDPDKGAAEDIARDLQAMVMEGLAPRR